VLVAAESDTDGSTYDFGDTNQHIEPAADAAADGFAVSNFDAVADIDVGANGNADGITIDDGKPDRSTDAPPDTDCNIEPSAYRHAGGAAFGDPNAHGNGVAVAVGNHHLWRQRNGDPDRDG